MYNVVMNGRDAHDHPLLETLTPREHEILNCIGDGMSNRQIADHLTIALSTVKWYIRQIYSKLGVSKRDEAVARAQSLGLLSQSARETVTRHNLSLAAAMPFVGRERELASLAKLIADPQLRIITILGPGGIGKTRLALEAAGRELRSQPLFPDGVFFVSLAPVDSADEIVAQLAAKLNFQFSNGGERSGGEMQQIVDYLGQKQILLVMDNFEHILDGRRLLTEISGQAAKIKLLVTSRERLQLRGEQLFPLHGLEMPQKGTAKGDTVADYAAAQLFLNTARRSTPDFNLIEEDVEHLYRICRLVEGMPLGLELAASCAGLMPLSRIADGLDHGLKLLSSEHYDVPTRHRSMGATLDLSWRRLRSEQKFAFQQLTVFRGGFTRMAALEVASTTLPLLVTLVNKSWLSYDRERDRYNVHELLRQYGAGNLHLDPAREQGARDRHCAYFCGNLKEGEDDWHGAKQQEVAAAVRGDIENIKAAWRWASDQGNVSLLNQGLNSLCSFFMWEGQMKEGQIAFRELNSIGTSLSAETAAAAMTRGSELDLWQTADGLL